MDYGEIYRNSQESNKKSIKRTSKLGEPIMAPSAQEQSAPTSGPSPMAANMAKAASSGGTPTQMGSNMLVASGNPYAMAAGVGLSTIAAIDAAKKKKAQDEYNAKVDKLNREQNAYSNLASLAQRLKSL